MSKPKAGKRPVPSCHPSPTLSQTVRQLQHHFSVAKSVMSTARQDVSMHRCDWKQKVGKRPAPSRNRSPTLSQTVRSHRHSPNTISRWQNLLHPPPAPRCAHASVRLETPKARTQPAPSRRRALQHSRRLRAATSTVPTPFLDAGKSVEPTTHAKMCATVGATGK